MIAATASKSRRAARERVHAAAPNGSWLTAVAGSGFGRVHNSITSLHRTLRPALRIAGQPLGSIDIVNSQPALLALLIHNTDSSIHDRHTFTPKVGVVGYNQLATSGRLYEHLMEWTGLSRREVKVGLLHACPASRRPALLFH